jgi:hypothetical protein
VNIPDRKYGVTGIYNKHIKKPRMPHTLGVCFWIFLLTEAKEQIHSNDMDHLLFPVRQIVCGITDGGFWIHHDGFA